MLSTSSTENPPESHSAIEPDGRLSRFLFRGEFDRELSAVRSSAFLPRNGETSVFYTSLLDAQAIWDLGEREVASVRKRTLLARADLRASVVDQTGLVLNYNDSPKWHANIVGWPPESDFPAVLSIAQRLSAAAVLVLKEVDD
jgi:hypothetical protein